MKSAVKLMNEESFWPGKSLLSYFCGHANNLKVISSNFFLTFWSKNYPQLKLKPLETFVGQNLPKLHENFFDNYIVMKFQVFVVSELLQIKSAC
jgi:hypothetical protein